MLPTDSPALDVAILPGVGRFGTSAQIFIDGNVTTVSHTILRRCRSTNTRKAASTASDVTGPRRAVVHVLVDMVARAVTQVAPPSWDFLGGVFITAPASSTSTLFVPMIMMRAVGRSAMRLARSQVHTTAPHTIMKSFRSASTHSAAAAAPNVAGLRPVAVHDLVGSAARTATQVATSSWDPLGGMFIIASTSSTSTLFLPMDTTTAVGSSAIRLARPQVRAEVRLRPSPLSARRSRSNGGKRVASSGGAKVRGVGRGYGISVNVSRSIAVI